MPLSSLYYLDAYENNKHFWQNSGKFFSERHSVPRLVHLGTLPVGKAGTHGHIAHRLQNHKGCFMLKNLSTPSLFCCNESEEEKKFCVAASTKWSSRIRNSKIKIYCLKFDRSWFQFRLLEVSLHVRFCTAILNRKITLLFCSRSRRQNVAAFTTLFNNFRMVSIS